jgi:predicted ribosome quality control (RQC) complex YloA/Tae2 family protein
MAEQAEHIPSPQRHAQRRQRLLSMVQEERERLERRNASLASEAARATAAEDLRQAGELIYAYLWQLEPGQDVLEVDGQRVKLDPRLSPTENAQEYFERYRKAQSATAQIPELMEQGDVELRYLDQLATQIAQAPGFAELEVLASEWQVLQATEEPGKKRKTPTIRRPQPLTDEDGNLIYIGRSGPQNDLLTFDLAGPDDTWLHARGRWGLPRHHPLDPAGRARESTNRGGSRSAGRVVQRCPGKRRGGGGRCSTALCTEDQGRRSRHGDLPQRTHDPGTAPA